MDHYKALGVHRNASKEEIKQAFRKLAMQFHPDKHAHSPKQVKDTATLQFKQLSEAYETLTDDRKRADYNIGRREAGNSSSSANYRSGAYGGSRYGYEYNNFGYGYSGYAASGRGKNSGATLHFEGLLRLFTMGTFLRNVAFAGVLIGGMYWIDAGRDALWNMKNSGKSFEEALESIKQAKGVKDKT